MRAHAFLLPLVVAALAADAGAQSNDLTAPLVAIVADGGDAPRLEQLLRAGGLRTRRVAVADCAPEVLRLADVVVVDWPEDREFGAVPPLGELDRWDRPTVFVGTSGERFARRWGLPTPVELMEADADARGPETATLAPPDGAATQVLRQGNLFHFSRPLPAVVAAAAERDWFVRTVRTAARFGADRPILRRPVAADATAAAERARRESIDANAQLLGIDIRSRDDLLALPAAYQGPHGPKVAALLRESIADGLDAEWSRSTWKSWLGNRRQQLVWDESSYVWRVDQLAFWRGVTSEQLRGDDRADAPEPAADAVALAAKVLQRYGGRALDDLATFSCWRDDVCYLWDRRHGCFRMENHGVLPPGARATAWEVAVLDTAADRDVIWGGGPPPRPRVSARSAYRDLLARLFLPALLLEPSTALARDAAADSAGQQMLVARLGLRGTDPRTNYHLLVDPATGAISRIEERRDGRVRATLLLEATVACGPMQLPSRWSQEERRRRATIGIDLPSWNPQLPDGLANATERLTAPRAR